MACVSGHTNARRPLPSISPLLLGVATFFVTVPALAEDGPDADYMRLSNRRDFRSVLRRPRLENLPARARNGLFRPPRRVCLDRQASAPGELVSDPKQRTNLRLFGRVGDRSSAELQLQIVGVHPQRDAMLLKLHRESDSKPIDYLELTDKPTLPLLQVFAAGFPALSDGTLRIIAAHMTSDLGEGKQLGEVGAKLEGGFSGGPVLSERKVVGLVESSSTAGHAIPLISSQSGPSEAGSRRTSFCQSRWRECERSSLLGPRG